MENLDGLNLTPRTRRVLEAAIRDARQRGHGYLGTEHLLLGLLTEPDAIATRVLADLGVLEQARERVLALMESAEYSRPPERHATVPYESEGELVMPWLDPAVADERAALGLPSIAQLRAYISEVNRQRAAALALTEGLPPEADVRRIWRPWTRQELLERREREGAACWRDGDELVFVHQADADHVRLSLGLQSEMWRLESDLWVVGYRLRRIDEAFVSYTFVADDDFAAAFSGGASRPGAGRPLRSCRSRPPP